MVKKTALRIAAAGLLALGFSSPVFASGYECNSGDPKEWVSVDDIRADLIALGYEVRKIEVEDGCYEAYAKKDSQRMEVFVNPKSGEIEKIKVK